MISMWEWSTPKAYLHDAISTDKRNPRVNANGLIYGSPEESTDMVPVLNPITNEASQIKHPFRDPNTPSSLDYIRTVIRCTGATIRIGIATRLFTIRSSTKRDAFGSPRASERPEKSGLLQSGLRSSLGQGGAAEYLSAPALHVRSENRKIFADRHMLRHAASLLRS